MSLQHFIDPPAPPPDGRQSPTALGVQRGACRLLRALGFSSICELPLASGRRADIVGLSERGDIWIVEVKSSLADFRVDAKWHEYRQHCDRLYFAAPETLAPSIFPEDAGLMIADRFAATVLREAPEHRLPPATRRAVTLRFARAAAARLHLLGDPECGAPS